MSVNLGVGDILQCENGHDMYEMVESAGRGDTVRASSMKACEGLPDPVSGMTFPSCPQCGGHCLAEYTTGWRPVRIKRANGFEL